MGRYRDLWASGKFVLKARAEEDRAQHQSAFVQYKQQSPEIASTDGSSAVLNALKSRRGQETGRWLRELVPQPAIEARAEEIAGNRDCFENIVLWMDALFAEFIDLAFEFNKSAAGTEMLATCLKPTICERSSNDEWYRSVAKVYQGRVTTTHWTLVVKGSGESIAIYMLPSAMWLAFTVGQVGEQDYPAFMELQRSSETKNWSLGGEPISLLNIKSLVKELLGDLIRVSSGIMSESELFSPSAALPSLGENVAVGYKQRSLADKDSSQEVLNSTLPLKLTMPDACDIVDGIIDLELKRLYVAAGAPPGSGQDSNGIRKQISAIEGFRLRMLEAFEEYTVLTIPLTAVQKVKASSFELMR